MASNFGIDAAVGFGPSPLSDLDHLLVELEVPLLIEPGFFNNDGDGPLPEDGSSGPDGGGYSPLPAFWGAGIANDVIDPVASGGKFTINPDGSTTIDASGIRAAGAVPEPGVLAMIAFALVAAGACRTRRRT